MAIQTISSTKQKTMLHRDYTVDIGTLKQQRQAVVLQQINPIMHCQIKALVGSIHIIKRHIMLHHL